MLLIDYVKNQFPLVLSQEYMAENLSKLNQMINHIFLHAPTELSTQGSEYWSTYYQTKYETEHESTLLVTWMMEKIAYPISLVSSDMKSRLSFWGSQPRNIEQAQALYLLHHALCFKETGLGNYSYRASYSAIELAKIFINIGVELDVKLRSYPEIDHFVVMIRDHDNSWKIYDPLTNPELIFDEEEYNTHIKSLFKSVKNPKISYEFTITRKEIHKFESLSEKMNDLLRTESAQLSIDALKTDLNYLGFLQSKKISDPVFQKTNEAIQHLHALIYSDSMSISYTG